MVVVIVVVAACCFAPFVRLSLLVHWSPVVDIWTVYCCCCGCRTFIISSIPHRQTAALQCRLHDCVCPLYHDDDGDDEFATK